MKLRPVKEPPVRRTVGYSGTPLAKKLGIKAGSRICTMAAPPDYRAWLGVLPTDVSIAANGKDCDIVHLFAASIGELNRQLPIARARIHPGGAIWVSWPKKASGIRSDVTEDAVRNRALQTDLVDIKVCAVTEIWSGLKLVVRKHLR